MKKLSLAVLVGIGLSAVGVSSASAVTIEPPVGDSKISMIQAETGESFILPTVSENLVTDGYEVESVEVLMPVQLKGDLSTDKRSVAISIDEEAPEKVYPITLISETTKTIKECTDDGCSSSQTRFTSHSHYRVTVDNPNFNSSSNLIINNDDENHEAPEAKSDSITTTPVAPTQPKAPALKAPVKEEVTKAVSSPEQAKPETKTMTSTKILTKPVTEKASAKAQQSEQSTQRAVSDSKAIEQPKATTTHKTAVKLSERRTEPVKAPSQGTVSGEIMPASSIERPVVVSNANIGDKPVKAEVNDSKPEPRAKHAKVTSSLDEAMQDSQREVSPQKSESEKLQDLETLDKEKAMMGKVAGIATGAVALLVLGGIATVLVIANQSMTLINRIRKNKENS